jgi:hypothetical protein
MSAGRPISQGVCPPLLTGEGGGDGVDEESNHTTVRKPGSL